MGGKENGAGGSNTFNFVFADVDVRGRGDGVRGEVVDHLVYDVCKL